MCLYLIVVRGQLVQKLFDAMLLPGAVDVGDLVLWQAREVELDLHRAGSVVSGRCALRPRPSSPPGRRSLDASSLPLHHGHNGNEGFPSVPEGFQLAGTLVLLCSPGKASQKRQCQVGVHTAAGAG